MSYREKPVFCYRVEGKSTSVCQSEAVVWKLSLIAVGLTQTCLCVSGGGGLSPLRLREPTRLGCQCPVRVCEAAQPWGRERGGERAGERGGEGVARESNKMLVSTKQ